MIKLKRMVTVLLAAAVTVSSFGVTGIKVEAKENTIAKSDSVIYKYVSSEQGLRNYIEGDGAYSSQDEITTEWERYTDVHKVTFPESGKLVVASMYQDESQDNVYARFQLFANKSLTAKIGEDSCIDYVTDDFTVYSVKKGTYYYRASRWNGTEKIKITTYLGFIPKSGKMKESGMKSAANTKATAVSVKAIKNVKELNTYIENDGAYASQEVDKNEWKGTTGYHKFTIKNPGWVVFNSIADKNGNYINVKVFANADMTAKVFSYRPTDKLGDGKMVYLQAGTYYYYGSRWNGTTPITYTNFIGHISTKDRITVKSISKNSDGASAKVTFSYDKAYLKSFAKGRIRIVKGSVSPNKIADKDTWKGYEVASNVINITSNGTYSARIETNGDNCYGMTTFKVSGLKNTTPLKATVTSAKRNAKTISGKSQAYMKVYVKYGNKTYSTKADKKGKWSVKTKSKLTKGASIKVVVKNSAGKTSKSSYYKVK